MICYFSFAIPESVEMNLESVAVLRPEVLLS